MHELSMTQRILSIALEKANAVHASKISRINLVIGELSGIVSECVELYFGILSRNTVAAEASLSFRKPPTELRCRNCETIFSPSDSHWACPKCRRQEIEIVSGRNCSVESIEVE